MKLKLFQLVFSLFFIHFCSFAQNDCEFSKVKQLEKDYSKEKKKTIKQYEGKGNLAYSIAECYRQNSDSTCYKWYRTAAEDYKKDYESATDKKNKAELLYKIGFCYFYSNNFKQAELFFRKSIKAKVDKADAFYYLGICLKKQNKCEEAIEEFSQYKKQCVQCGDVEKQIEIA